MNFKWKIMASELHEKKKFDEIFQLFHVANTDEKHSNEKIGGTGVGLTLIKRILESYNGEIWLTSKEGEGTTFFFTIPDISKKEQNKELTIHS